jgi:hypothetical protein
MIYACGAALKIYARGTQRMNRLHPEDLERLAHKRAGAKLGWYVHAAVYLVVNLFIFALSRYGFGTRGWAALPLLGWGLGLAVHGISVFLLGAGGGLRERLLQRERAHLQREHDAP